MKIVMICLDRLRRLLARIAPYVVVEIVLPGGTLLALLLYLLRRRRGMHLQVPLGLRRGAGHATRSFPAAIRASEKMA